MVSMRVVFLYSFVWAISSGSQSDEWKVEVIDSSVLTAILLSLSYVTSVKIAHESGMRAEGLVYDTTGARLLWTNGNCPTPGYGLDEVMCASEGAYSGKGYVCRSHSGHANGQLVVGDMLFTAETVGRRISKSFIGNPGTSQDFLTHVGYRRLNSPNDFAYHEASGELWFTDPEYGCAQFEHKESCPQLPNRVYSVRLEAGESKEVYVLPFAFDRPNGLCFCPDYSCVYVVDSGAIHSSPESIDLSRPHNVTKIDLDEMGRAIGSPTLFAVVDSPTNLGGIPDGIKTDVEGNVYVAAGDGIQIFAPSGSLAGRLLLNGGRQQCSNIVFGGRSGHSLFVGCGEDVYQVSVKIPGSYLPHPTEEEAHVRVPRLRSHESIMAVST